jgi:hypothetical protein
MYWIVLNALFGFWAMAATIWIRTNSRALPPTRLRANAAVGIGVGCVVFGCLGLLFDVGSTSAWVAFALTGPIYFILASYIRARISDRRSR